MILRYLLCTSLRNRISLFLSRLIMVFSLKRKFSCAFPASKTFLYYKARAETLIFLLSKSSFFYTVYYVLFLISKWSLFWNQLFWLFCYKHLYKLVFFVSYVPAYRICFCLYVSIISFFLCWEKHVIRQRLPYLFIVLMSFFGMVSTSLDIFWLKIWSKQIKPFSSSQKKCLEINYYFYIKIN